MKILFYLLTVIIGALLGYLYFRLIGCRSGGWPITANVWSSVVMGAVIGYLLLSPIVTKYFDNKNLDDNKNDSQEQLEDQEDNSQG